jgi:diguanylate cyclase (GGDEF)-like protein
MNPDEEPRASWICRDEFERARFMDLNGRLLRANTYIMIAIAICILAAIPYLTAGVGVIPAAIGLAVFAGMQRSAPRFARPELWVFTALLGAEAMIVWAIVLNEEAMTPAMALLCWPVAGVAGRFPNRASLPGLGFALVLATTAVLIADPEILSRDPLVLALLLVALIAIHTVSTVLRESDVENRGAAILDPLTGMLNRTTLMSRTAEIEQRSRLNGEPVGVILADLDRFKRVNDEHGHATGDEVLEEVASRVRGTLRAYDLAFRIGGEEFAVLLLGASPAETRAAAERLREAVCEQPVAGLSITVSVGIAASARGTKFDWDKVYAEADRALYEAKARGRDRVASAITADARSRAMGRRRTAEHA